MKKLVRVINSLLLGEEPREKDRENAALKKPGKRVAAWRLIGNRTKGVWKGDYSPNDSPAVKLYADVSPGCLLHYEPGPMMPDEVELALYTGTESGRIEVGYIIPHQNWWATWTCPHRTVIAHAYGFAFTLGYSEYPRGFCTFSEALCFPDEPSIFDRLRYDWHPLIWNLGIIRILGYKPQLACASLATKCAYRRFFVLSWFLHILGGTPGLMKLGVYKREWRDALDRQRQ